jgi:hypothetical protein
MRYILAVLLFACGIPAHDIPDAAIPDPDAGALVAACVQDAHPYTDLEIVSMVLDNGSVVATCRAQAGTQTLWWDERCTVGPCSCEVVEGSQRWE